MKRKRNFTNLTGTKKDGLLYGVQFDSRRQIWRAQITVEGKRLEKTFSLSVHGEEAQSKALQWRKDQMLSLYGEQEELPAGQKRCSKCEVVGLLAMFPIATGKPEAGHYRRSICRQCLIALPKTSLIHRLRVLIHSSQLCASLRKASGREKAGSHELTLSNLEQLYQEQKGRCAISGLLLTLSGDWQMSLDRIDDFSGYVWNDRNVRLVCLEFQVGYTGYDSSLTQYTPWSREKFESARERIASKATPQELEDIKKEIHNARNPTRKHFSGYKCRRIEPQEAKKYRNKLLVTHLECRHCHAMLPPTSFPWLKRAWHKRDRNCLNCTKIINRSAPKSLRSRALALSHIQSRKEIAEKKPVQLTTNDILDQLLLQQGRCYYSGMKMSFQPLTNWMMSIERLNCNQGHVLGNIVLVAFEFNTPHKQWSRDKIKHAWNLETTTS
jgi:hypothetical protein